MIEVHLAEAITVCLPGILLEIIASAAGATTHETSSEKLPFTTQGIKVTLSRINIILYGDLGEIVNDLWWFRSCSCPGGRSVQQRDREDSWEW